MKYMLLMYANETDALEYTSEKGPDVAKEWYALVTDANTAGVMVSTNGLQPITDATTVRFRNGKTLTADGPFAETHEQLGGYFLIDCKDLDEAIGWATKIPTAKYGSIEIRPLWSQK